MTQKMSRRTGKWGETVQKPFEALKAPKKGINATARTVVKRNIVEEKYKAIIDALYRE